MLLTDNAYPQFYGEVNDVHGSLYMVACPGAHPVFKYSSSWHNSTVQMSACHRTEQSLLADLSRHPALEQKTDIPPDIVEKMLKAYQEHRSRYARNGQ